MVRKSTYDLNLPGCPSVLPERSVLDDNIDPALPREMESVDGDFAATSGLNDDNEVVKGPA